MYFVVNRTFPVPLLEILWLFSVLLLIIHCNQAPCVFEQGGFILAQKIRVGFLLVAQGIGGLIGIIGHSKSSCYQAIVCFFQRLIQRPRTAITQVRTTTAVNEHGIAGHQMVTHKSTAHKWNGQALLKF